MDHSVYLKIFFVFALIALAAFFSGSEVALFSLDKKKLKFIFVADSLFYRYISVLLDNPRRLLITILIGNNLVHVALSLVGVSLTLDIAHRYNFSENIAILIDIVVLTGLIIFFGEITPKVFASGNPKLFSKVVSIPLFWINIIVFPIAETLNELIRSVASRLRLDRKKLVITHEEIYHLADLGAEHGALEGNEHELIRSVVDAQDINVSKVMQPRVKMDAVSLNNSIEEIAALIIEKGHSRLPLYGSNIDEIIGIIYAKDLLPFWKNKSTNKKLNLKNIARKALFVPETKLVKELMTEFRVNKMHLAIVVDEFGGTAGLVTLEDILEEMIGEIRDEYDNEKDNIVKIDELTFSLSGIVSVNEIEELLKIKLETDEDQFDTLAGYILNYAGEIPKEGYYFIEQGFRFSVEKVISNRIETIMVKKVL